MYDKRDEENSFTPLARKLLWLDKPSSVSTLVTGLIVVCVILFVIDLFYHRHGYFKFETTSAFYAVVGFCAFALIVIAAGQLRRVIKRDEDYYKEFSVHAEDYPAEGLQRLDHAPQSTSSGSAASRSGPADTDTGANTGGEG